MADKQWSQNELGRKLGLPAMTVNKWVNAVSRPRDEYLDKLCQVLNVQRSDILSDKSAIPNLSIPAAYPVRMLGRICAGDGVLQDESFDGYFFVDNSIRADYCLRVEGDSMKDAGINHGDVAFLRKSYNFLSGEIYAVVYGDEPTASLKRVYEQQGGVMLMPCNQKYSPISLSSEDDFIIVGECIGIYHPR